MNYPEIADMVECPTCGRKPGYWCMGPDGYPANHTHIERRRVANAHFLTLVCIWCGKQCWTEDELEAHEEACQG